jgi:hypothetical protein
MHAWLSSGTRQRTKSLWKGASEGDMTIDDSSDGSPQTIEIGSDSPIGITTLEYPFSWPRIAPAEVMRRRPRGVVPNPQARPIWEQNGNSTGDISPMRLQHTQIEAVS